MFKSTYAETNTQFKKLKIELFLAQKYKHTIPDTDTHQHRHVRVFHLFIH